MPAESGEEKMKNCRNEYEKISFSKNNISVSFSVVGSLKWQKQITLPNPRPTCRQTGRRTPDTCSS